MLLDAKWIGVAGAAAAVLAAYAQYRRRSGSSTRKRRVVITGGCGNLGTKLATRLLASGERDSMVKVPAWLCSASPPAPPQGAPGSSGKLGTS